MTSDLFSTIRQEHEEVKSIFEKLKKEESSDERSTLLISLRRALIPHMKSEEKTIYPELLNSDEESNEMALEATEEHHAVRMILKTLIDLPTDDERFTARATVVNEMIEHHIKEEEGKILKKLKSDFSKEQLNDILQNFIEEKKIIKEKM